MKPLWFAQKRDVSTPLTPSLFLLAHPISHALPIPSHPLSSAGKTKLWPTLVEQIRSPPDDDVVLPDH